MKYKNSDKYLLILSVVLTVLIDILIKPILYLESSIYNLIITDFLIVSFLGYIGLAFAYKENLNTFLPKHNYSDLPKRIFIIYSLLVFFLIILNTVTWIIYSGGNIPLPSWINITSPGLAVIIAIRAAFMEEIVFRLFLISFILYALKQLNVIIEFNQKLSIILSSIIFSFTFHSGSIISIISGMILGAVFLNFGLLYAIIIHFLADVIPFIILSVQK